MSWWAKLAGMPIGPPRIDRRSGPDLERWHERVTGIGPAFSAWEADVLPLNYTRGVRDATKASPLGIRGGRR